MVSKETMIKDLKEFFKDEDLTSITDDESSSFIASTPDDIRSNIRKYISRIVVSRLSFGKFKIKYIFKDKVEKEYGFYSIVHKCEYYDSDGKFIEI